MTHPIYEKLRQLNLAKSSGVNVRAVENLTADGVSRVADELSAVTSAPPVMPTPGELVHAASLSLGGGRALCASLSCRTENARQVSQVAALYSDRIYISNYFVHHRYQTPDASHLAAVREDLIEDIQVILQMKPALEAGLVEFFTAPPIDCPHCVAREVFGTPADERLERARRQLNRRFLSEVNVRIFELDGTFHTQFDGPDDLLGHFGGVSGRDAPEPLAAYPRLYERLMRGDMVSLRREVRRKLGVHHFLTYRVLENITYEIVCSQALGASLLTDRDLDVDILGAISGNPEVQARNRLALEHLTSEVPFLPEVPLEKVVRLRRDEAEAFILYRRALNRAVSEYRDETNLTPSHARQLYGDIIAPRLAVIDQKVKLARKRLTKELRRDVTAWVGAISFGVYTGVLPPTTLAIASAVGFTSLVAGSLKKLMNNSDLDDEVRSDEFYFLWRVKNLTTKRRRKAA